tara:strand:+ start:398 stop:832 length:435 start_codon:yes stop_codon:yes gene_type:complete
MILEIENCILQDTNNARGVKGKIMVERNELLDTLARKHSQDMARSGNVDHVDSRGRELKHRIPLTIDVQGRSYQAAENIGMIPLGRVEGLGIIKNTGPSIGNAFVESWMGSDGHRTNILGDYAMIGIGVALKGIRYYATQVFFK